jgi:hypothetical protein
MKVISQDMVHCFKHANTHRANEPCLACVLEQARKNVKHLTLLEMGRIGEFIEDEADVFDIHKILKRGPWSP